MHGTYLNNVQIPKDTRMQVKDKDEVKFGAEVRRGSEVFPACRFRLEYTITPAKTSSTYEFPEYSESDLDEEEEDFLYSDDSLQRRQSSEDGVTSIPSPISMSVAKAAEDVNAIDLTGDDQPTPSPVIDLTEETPNESRIKDTMNGRPADLNETSDRIAISIHASNPMTVSKETDVTTNFSSDSDNQDEDNNSIASSSSSSDDGEDEEEDYLSQELDEDELISSDEEDYPMEEEFPVDESDEEAILEAVHAIDNATRFAVATHENPPVYLNEKNRLDLVGVSSDDEDSESDFRLSEAGAEGMKAMYKGCLLEAVPLLLPSIRNMDEKDVANQVKPLVSSNMTAAVESMPLFQQIAQAQKDAEVPLELPSMSFRQPSPSDAAMVKIRAGPSESSCHPTIQSLGERTGKSSFFAAREVNKLRFSSGEPRTPTAASNLAARIFSSATSEPKAASTVLTPPQSTISNITGTTIEMMPTRDICSFLDKPDTTPLPREPSPLPDMTSAATYTVSKDSMVATKTATILPPRAALKIKDMCDDTSSPTTLKRTAEHISSATVKDIIWAESASATTQPINTKAAPFKISEPMVFPCTQDVPRPTKKFKRVMENVGYAAIGGLAVGAGLFAALVATAPAL